jgi:hypothetical protein
MKLLILEIDLPIRTGITLLMIYRIWLSDV